MIIYPNAKINLGLNIVARRNDGYHDIETCFVPASLCDIIEFIEAGQTSFHSTGIPVPGEALENTCVAAWKILAADFKISPVQIHLHKQIPIGAGLGGGSADGAFMLKGINEHFDLQLTETQLLTYAARLGSDCSFFILNKPSYASGRGEVLELLDLDMSAFRLVLVNPGIHISTREAYSSIVPRYPQQNIRELIKLSQDKWMASLTNDFEAYALTKYPVIKHIKETLYSLGATFALMTGSGSTVFGLFERDKVLKFEGLFPGMFVWTEQ
jgi:4-diphosphocytidyl-2-C-methyl-D-erythritol kinase